ncbi:Alpha-ketoglutarate-dependent dioxygenase AlkB [Roseobacter fucihabitans]|uniref:Alpha-ketoglutarate-dependent dioxygenase AlkB n=1 Tax=Roseobacter fucihabitans TaxID=1537242 RepID=A0ABZ2BZZ2_9RHOB|nr:alpha-ketoglutarate-dependent dioxygenase AlkB [Roseobacter litoralis]MBC6963818.1 Alpha-ketoglutarate-dependent dioxygenase AlkB [Roseobacter litoralis]MBC6964097.1 Alpha-ketoglutarate-dependent dioxygenase AlkB [Roseobacter litoralis]
MSVLKVSGFEIHKAYLSTEAQNDLLNDLRDVVRIAPFTAPVTPGGKPMSVKMTAAGPYGWVTDHEGYRYSPTHPLGSPWPEMPQSVLDIWRDVTSLAQTPECCLINYYGEGARMGLHRDKDEASFEWPVVSVSLGDDGLFRMGGRARGDATQSIWLNSGDVVVMGGAARLAYHGVDRIRFGSSSLLAKGGRINLTMRVVSI